jgi:hypothetical protein
MKPTSWRHFLLYLLLGLIPVGQQAALVCCLPCILGNEKAGQEQQQHGGQENPGSPATDKACETCNLCGSLLASAPPFLTLFTFDNHGASCEGWSIQPHDPIPAIPFASRAPPALQI